MYHSPMNPTWPWPSLSSNKNNGSLPPGPVMVDVEGFELTDHERQRLQHPLVGAVVLFSRNYQNPQQLHKLCRQIHEARSEPLLIAVDHEGGRVQRFRTEGFTQLPHMRDLGRLYDQDRPKALRLAVETGYLLAAELRACGVDFTFAPVLDLDFNKSEIIGKRAFHNDPETVAILSNALIHGLSLAGMACCGKHFPGHGFVAGDSHLELPVDDRSLEEIMATDVVPYLSLGDMVLKSVMMAHVVYSQVDKQPAGYSEFWIKEVLRKRLNYQGLVFSDDLTMEGAVAAGSITQRAQAAFKAGCDMVMVCNRPDLSDELLGELDHHPSSETVNRIRALMPLSPFMDWQQLQQDSRYQHAKEFQHSAVS